MINVLKDDIVVSVRHQKFEIRRLFGSAYSSYVRGMRPIFVIIHVYDSMFLFGSSPEVDKNLITL
jgi:hypothetical protein